MRTYYVVVVFYLHIGIGAVISGLLLDGLERSVPCRVIHAVNLMALTATASRATRTKPAWT